MSHGLSAVGVAKSFGATVALSEGNLEAEAGEVHALLGENGAGKSTLLGIVSGLIRPDRGELRIGGETFAPGSPLEARLAGIATVTQEPAIADDLSIAENVCLGAEPSRFGLVDGTTLRSIAKKALAQVGLALDVDAPAFTLSPAERQLVAIARALATTKPRVLILDEPTSSLPAAEVDRVLEAARSLAGAGACVLYVSHHLEEVTRVADRYTVLRAGKTIASGQVAGVSVGQLAELVVGRALDVSRRSDDTTSRASTLALKATDVAGVSLPVRASFELEKGEILGIAGLVGSGRTELLRVLFGLDPMKSGRVKIGEHVEGGAATPSERLAQGMGLLSEERKGEGIAEDMSISDNLTLSRLGPVSSFGLVSSDRQTRVARGWLERLSVRASGPDAPLSALSGGNQQKVALGRLLHHDVDVLLLDEPTRGIDPGSREEIYRITRDLVAKGKSIVWVSSQLGELFAVCARIAVMHRGVLGSPTPVAELDEASLLAEVSGA